MPQRRVKGGESTGGSMRAKDIGRHHCEQCVCSHQHPCYNAAPELLAALEEMIDMRCGKDINAALARARAAIAKARGI